MFNQHIMQTNINFILAIVYSLSKMKINKKEFRPCNSRKCKHKFSKSIAIKNIYSSSSHALMGDNLVGERQRIILIKIIIVDGNRQRWENSIENMENFQNAYLIYRGIWQWYRLFASIFYVCFSFLLFGRRHMWIDWNIWNRYA